MRSNGRPYDAQQVPARSAYRQIQISVQSARSKIFVYMSRYKQRNRVLFFEKPVYRFAASCNIPRYGSNVEIFLSQVGSAEGYIPVTTLDNRL